MLFRSLRTDARRSYYAHGHPDFQKETPVEWQDEFYDDDDFGPSRLSARRDARLNGVLQPGLRRREVPSHLSQSPLEGPLGERARRTGAITDQRRREIMALDDGFETGNMGEEQYRFKIEEVEKRNNEAEKALEKDFSSAFIKRTKAQLDAYNQVRDTSYQRGRYPSHQPVEWHREERKQEARWQEQAFHSPEDERALEEYFNMRRYGEKGLEAWDQGETETEMLARRKAEHQAELRARLEALDDEWDQAAQETDAITHREEMDALDERFKHRPFAKRRLNKHGVVFQHSGPHPEKMPKEHNRENRVPIRGNFAPEKKDSEK